MTTFAALRDPRFIQGKALIHAKKYDAGIDCMCELLEALVTAYDPEHLETAPVLYEYGSALLLKAESTANLFGDAVEDASDKKDSNAPALTGIEKAQRAAAESSATAEDLEIAWEVLEVARVILKKNLDNVQARILLARVHLRLGDHELDNGQLVDAIRDYSECLSPRLGSLPATDRRLADAHTSLAMAHLYNSVPREKADPTAQRQERVTAAEHYGLAADVFESLIEESVKTMSTELSVTVTAALATKPKSSSSSSSSNSSSSSVSTSSVSDSTWYSTFKVPVLTIGGESNGLSTEDKALYELIDSLQILREKCLETGKLAAETETSAAPTNATGVQVGADGSQTSIGFGEPSSMFAQDGFDKPTFNTLSSTASSSSSSSSSINPGNVSILQPRPAPPSSESNNLQTNMLVPKKKKAKLDHQTVSAP